MAVTIKKQITSLLEDHLDEYGTFNTDFIVAYTVDLIRVMVVETIEESRNTSQAIIKVEKLLK